MNKHYVIWPVILVAAFIAYFIQFDKADTLAVKQKEEREAREAAAKAQEKERLKEQAAIENKRVSDEKAKEEEKKIAEREAKQFAKDQAVRDETEKLRVQIDAQAKEKGELQAKLAETRRARLKAEADAFDLARAVELAKIERRNVENEIQRAVGIVANKVDATSLVQVPVFAAETQKK